MGVNEWGKGKGRNCRYRVTWLGEGEGILTGARVVGEWIRSVDGRREEF